MITELVVTGKDGKYLSIKPDWPHNGLIVEHIHHHISHWNGDKEHCAIYYKDGERIDNYFDFVSITYDIESEAGDER